MMEPELELIPVKFVWKNFDEVVRILEKLEQKKAIPMKIGDKIGKAVLISMESKSRIKFGKLIHTVEKKYIFLERDKEGTMIYSLRIVS